MTIPRTDDLDVNEDIYDAFSSRNKSLLFRFFDLFRDTIDHRSTNKSTYTKEDLLRIIASKLQQPAEEFLEDYERLREEGVMTGPAVDYLAEHFDIPEEELDISNRFELLLLIYEEELTDAIGQIIIKTKIKSYSATRAFYIDTELNLEQVGERIDSFHQNWNLDNEDPDAVYVDEEFSSDNLVVLKIYQEIGEKRPFTFSFRLDKDTKDEIPKVPELTRATYYKLKTIRFQLERVDGETELIFTDSFNGWRATLGQFFSEVFSVDDILEDLSVRESDVANEIEDVIVESVEAREDPVSNARETIEEKQTDALKKVNSLDLPTDRKEELEHSIQTIQLSGSEILDDQSIKTQEFRLVAGLDDLFSSVDGIEEGFREMLKQADTESRAFVLTINDRPVQFSQGAWTHLGAGTLPERDKRALQIFFGGS